MNDKEPYCPICSTQFRSLPVYFLESKHMHSQLHKSIHKRMVSGFLKVPLFVLVFLLIRCLRFLHGSVGVFLLFKNDTFIWFSWENSNCDFLFDMTTCCSGSRVKHLHVGICMLKKMCVVQFTSCKHQQQYGMPKMMRNKKATHKRK